MFDRKKITYYKIKFGVEKKITKPKSMNSLLDKGFTVSKVTEIGNKTTIEIFSPKTREEAIREHGRRYGNMPF